MGVYGKTHEADALVRRDFLGPAAPICSSNESPSTPAIRDGKGVEQQSVKYRSSTET